MATKENYLKFLKRKVLMIDTIEESKELAQNVKDRLIEIIVNVKYED